MDKYIEVINEIENFDEIIKLQDTECVVTVCWNFLRHFYIILKMLKNVNNIYTWIVCLLRKKTKKIKLIGWRKEEILECITPD